MVVNKKVKAVRMMRIAGVWTKVIAIALGFTLSSEATLKAACISGTAPSYDDIEAIMLEQNGCNGRIGSFVSPAPEWRQATVFNCSTYWVLFWQPGSAPFPTRYSQFDLKGAIGTYTLSVGLADAIKVLRQDDFFALSPPDGDVTDTAMAVLSVRRCAVITRIRIFKGRGNAEPTAAKLFNDLTVFVQAAAKSQVSKTPEVFKQLGIFDPLPFP